MNTALVRAALSSMLTNWLSMSEAGRLPWKPCLPVMQKRQPILHPACELTHRVRRSPSGIITASTADSSFAPATGQLTLNRYFLVPSDDMALPAGADVPRS